MANPVSQNQKTRKVGKILVGSFCIFCRNSSLFYWQIDRLNIMDPSRIWAYDIKLSLCGFIFISLPRRIIFC